MINDVHTTTGKTVVDVMHDFRNEIVDFIATRAEMLQEELSLKASAIGKAIPMLVVGALFLLTAWFLITGAIIVVIAAALAGNPWAYAISFASVAVLYAVIGGMIALTGRNALKKNNVKPEKTIRVLQEDKVWIQAEASRLQA